MGEGGLDPGLSAISFWPRENPVLLEGGLAMPDDTAGEESCWLATYIPDESDRPADVEEG